MDIEVAFHIDLIGIPVLCPLRPVAYLITHLKGHQQMFHTHGYDALQERRALEMLTFFV